MTHAHKIAFRKKKMQKCTFLFFKTKKEKTFHSGTDNYRATLSQSPYASWPLNVTTGDVITSCRSEQSRSLSVSEEENKHRPETAAVGGHRRRVARRVPPSLSVRLHMVYFCRLSGSVRAVLPGPRSWLVDCKSRPCDGSSSAARACSGCAPAPSFLQCTLLYGWRSGVYTKGLRCQLLSCSCCYYILQLCSCHMFSFR